MRRAIRWVPALVVTATLLAGSSPATAQKKGNADKDKDANSEKTIKAGVLTGKITNVYEDKRAIRLAVTVPQQRIDAGAANSIQQAQLQMAQARARRDWNGMRAAQMSMAQAQARLVTVEYRTHEVELVVQDEAVVRAANPRLEFDEKGKIKKLSKAELKELKGGDPKVPGYKAEFGDVATEQVVQVALVRKKPEPAVKAKPKPKAAKGKGKGKDKDDEPAEAGDWLGDNLPQVSMILILRDAPPSGN